MSIVLCISSAYIAFYALLSFMDLDPPAFEKVESNNAINKINENIIFKDFSLFFLCFLLLLFLCTKCKPLLFSHSFKILNNFQVVD